MPRKPFGCPKCAKRFKSYSALEQHVAHVHPGITSLADASPSQRNDGSNRANEAAERIVAVEPIG